MHRIADKMRYVTKLAFLAALDMIKTRHQPTRGQLKDLV